MSSSKGINIKGIQHRALVWSILILILTTPLSSLYSQSSKSPLTFEQLDSMLDEADPLRKQGKFADALGISIKAMEYLPELKDNPEFKIRIIINLSNSLRKDL